MEDSIRRNYHGFYAGVETSLGQCYAELVTSVEPRVRPEILLMLYDYVIWYYALCDVIDV